MHSHCLAYVDPLGPSDTLIVRHEDKSNYVLRLATSVEHAERLDALWAWRLVVVIGSTTGIT